MRQKIKNKNVSFFCINSSKQVLQRNFFAKECQSITITVTVMEINPCGFYNTFYSPDRVTLLTKIHQIYITGQYRLLTK